MLIIHHTEKTLEDAVTERGSAVVASSPHHLLMARRFTLGGFEFKLWDETYEVRLGTFYDYQEAIDRFNEVCDGEEDRFGGVR